LLLSCRGVRGQRCTGTVTLTKPARRRAATKAAAGRASFRIAAGQSKTIRVQPSAALRALLRKRRTATAELKATMSGDGASRAPLKRPITIVRR
jgi:hypothetical protein